MLWITRSLRVVATFVSQLRSAPGGTSAAAAKAAYTAELGPYHGFLLRQVALVATRFVPPRPQIEAAFGLEEGGRGAAENALLSSLEGALCSAADGLEALMKAHGLWSTEKLSRLPTGLDVM